MTPQESCNQRAGKVVQVVQSFRGEREHLAGGLASIAAMDREDRLAA